MTKQTNRIQKSPLELKIDLKDQLELLVDGCNRYDNGFEIAGKQIAATLRILLHHQGKNSKSLLEQLGLRSQKRFVDTAGEIRERNLLPELNLLTWGMKSTEVRIFPQCAMPEPRPPSRLVPFSDWWTKSVIKDQHKKRFSRFDLVGNIADTDGGSHVDSGLFEDYLNFKISASKAMTAVSPAGEIAQQGRPELACARQIAHEVIITLRRDREFNWLDSYNPKTPT